MSTTPWTDALAAIRNLQALLGAGASYAAACECDTCAAITKAFAALTPERARLADCAEEMLSALRGSADMLTEAAKQLRWHTYNSHATICDRHAAAARAILAKAEGKDAP